MMTPLLHHHHHRGWTHGPLRGVPTRAIAAVEGELEAPAPAPASRESRRRKKKVQQCTIHCRLPLAVPEVGEA
jgi:hypothetical protein